MRHMTTKFNDGKFDFKRRITLKTSLVLVFDFMLVVVYSLKVAELESEAK